jgi:hypothetical protein
MRQGCPLSPLSVDVVLEFLARVIREEEERKGIQIGKKEVKVLLLADDVIVCLKDLKKLHQKLIVNINTFSKITRYKINLQKSVAFLCANTEQTEKECRKTTPFTKPQKLK